jgi:hypothetical protein
MRLTRILGLVAVMAITAMAFIGGSSASAAVLKSSLCKVSTNPCPTASKYALPQTVKATLESAVAKLETSSVTDECTKSEVTLEAKESREHDIHGLITSVTFGTCTCPTSLAIHLPWLGLLTQNALAATKDGTGGNPGGLVICNIPLVGNVHCTYETPEGTVTFKGGSPALAEANVELKLNTKESDGFCVFTGAAHWIANYKVTTPNPLFFALESES